MTIIKLFVYIGIIALAATLILAWYRAHKINYIDSFLQFFCGSLFVFSGWVKAIDPMGTAYKMEQYFDAFTSTAEGSFLKFMAPLFPFLKEYSISFSVGMIVLEIVLGIFLILGTYRKLTAWLFFAIMIFFTILTGFTYLTGYVPADVNFFEFSKWTEFNASQMKVKDCGCFGDFMKLVPKSSFNKDLVLMLPAFWFLFRWKHSHQLLSAGLRNAIAMMSIIGLVLFCISNFKWNEPMIDFRPFANGVNIVSKLKDERKAAGEVEVIAYKLRNKQTKQELDVPYQAYLDSFKQNSQFKASWETLDQIKSEPKIPITMISQFDVMSLEGESVTDLLLSESRYNLIIISPKVKYKTSVVETQKIDSLFRSDTMRTKIGRKESISIQKVFAALDTSIIKKNVYIWDPEFFTIVKNEILPLIDSVAGEKVTASAIFGGLSEEAISDLRTQLGTRYLFYEADDILLKSMMRSNPGLLLLREGKIVYKWHHKRLPSIKDLKEKYLNPAYDLIY